MIGVQKPDTLGVFQQLLDVAASACQVEDVFRVSFTDGFSDRVPTTP